MSKKESKKQRGGYYSKMVTGQTHGGPTHRIKWKLVDLGAADLNDCIGLEEVKGWENWMAKTFGARRSGVTVAYSDEVQHQTITLQLEVPHASGDSVMILPGGGSNINLGSNWWTYLVDPGGKKTTFNFNIDLSVLLRSRSSIPGKGYRYIDVRTTLAPPREKQHVNNLELGIYFEKHEKRHIRRDLLEAGMVAFEAQPVMAVAAPAAQPVLAEVAGAQPAMAPAPAPAPADPVQTTQRPTTTSYGYYPWTSGAGQPPGGYGNQ